METSRHVTPMTEKEAYAIWDRTNPKSEVMIAALKIKKREIRITSLLKLKPLISTSGRVKVTIEGYDGVTIGLSVWVRSRYFENTPSFPPRTSFRHARQRSSSATCSVTTTW